MIQYPPSVFIKTLFKLTPERQSKICIRLLLGKLVAMLKLPINSWGRESSRAETPAAVRSPRNNANNSGFPGAAAAARNHAQLSSLHPEFYQLACREKAQPQEL